MVPGCQRNDKRIALGQKELIKVCVAHLNLCGAGLHAMRYSAMSLALYPW